MQQLILILYVTILILAWVFAMPIFWESENEKQIVKEQSELAWWNKQLNDEDHIVHSHELYIERE